MTDVVALLERYGELLKAQRAENPMERLQAKIEMIEVEMALRFSSLDFVAGRDA
jgi:hypothetical protein